MHTIVIIRMYLLSLAAAVNINRKVGHNIHVHIQVIDTQLNNYTSDKTEALKEDSDGN